MLNLPKFLLEVGPKGFATRDVSSKPQNRCFKVLFTLFIQLSKGGVLEKARILLFPSVKTTEMSSLAKQIFMCKRTWNEIVTLSIQYTRQLTRAIRMHFCCCWDRASHSIMLASNSWSSLLPLPYNSTLNLVTFPDLIACSLVARNHRFCLPSKTQRKF